MQKLYILIALTVIFATYVYPDSDEYLYKSSLLQTPEVKFWTYELDDFNEVRIVYQIVDIDKEFISIDGTTDWSRSRRMDIVSHLSYDKSYINAVDPTLYAVLQKASFGGAFFYRFGDLFSFYAGASGNTRGDIETIGNDDSIRISGRTTFGYDIESFRIIAGTEVVRDFGISDYPSFYLGVSDDIHILPVAYTNWEVTDGFILNVGFPYNSIRVSPLKDIEIGGAYDIRSGDYEAVVRLRPLNNRFFLSGRYFREEVEDVKMDSTYTSARDSLRGGNYISQEIMTYAFDIGYNLPVLAADLIVAGRVGYFEGGDIVFRNERREETGSFESESGFFGGMSITTDF